MYQNCSVTFLCLPPFIRFIDSIVVAHCSCKKKNTGIDFFVEVDPNQLCETTFITSNFCLYESSSHYEFALKISQLYGRRNTAYSEHRLIKVSIYYSKYLLFI